MSKKTPGEVNLKILVKRLFIFVMAGIFICVYPILMGAEENTLKWEEFFYACGDVQTMQVIEGHVIGSMQQKGLAVFPNGEFALLVTWFTYENVRGRSKYKGYITYRFADGSTKYAEIEGSGNVPGEQKGSIVFIRGTGRFEGIEGSGIFVAVTPFRTEGAETYVKAEATYRLTSK
jgi:hypothetical protein